jgi:hypothetical protein
MFCHTLFVFSLNLATSLGGNVSGSVSSSCGIPLSLHRSIHHLLLSWCDLSASARTSGVFLSSSLCL